LTRRVASLNNTFSVDSAVYTSDAVRKKSDDGFGAGIAKSALEAVRTGRRNGGRVVLLSDSDARSGRKLWQVRQ